MQENNTCSVREKSIALQETIRATEEYLQQLNDSYRELVAEYPEEAGCDKSVLLLFSGQIMETTMDSVWEDLLNEDIYMCTTRMEVEGVADVVVVFRDKDVIAPNHSSETIRRCHACHKSNGVYFGLTSEEVGPVMKAMKENFGSTTFRVDGLKLRVKEK